MAIYSKVKINKLLNECKNETNTHRKGRKLEELVRYIFCKVPKVSHYGSNLLDGNRAHEIDVIFNNDTRFSELYFLGPSIITECKSSNDPTSSAQVGWFIRKLQDRVTNIGILISLNGITGNSDDGTSAYSEIISAVIRDRIRILLILK